MKNLRNKIVRSVAQHLATMLVAFIVVLCATFIIVGTPAEDGSITLDGSKAKIEQSTEEFIKDAKIVMAEQTKKALITINGKDEQVDLPTIESIDSSKSTKDEQSEVGGRGWAVDVSSPAAFRNATIGKCIDTDGAYGSQCWDLGNLFWQNYAGRSFNTCGTGAAKGTIQNGCWQRNAGSEFDMVWDRNQIKAGDWVIFGGGQWGHVGMALGGNNGGYVALLGTNQGGGWCAGGGSSTNQVNMSLGNFIGAFRPKKYNSAPKATPAPTPVANKPADDNIVGAVLRGEYGSGNDRVARLRAAGYDPASVQAAVNARVPVVAPTVRSYAPPAVNRTGNAYVVKRGDTLGHIALRNGWHGANGLFGNNGYTQALANRNGIANRGLIYPGQVIRP